MKFHIKYCVLLIVAVCLLESVTSAPTSLEKEVKKTEEKDEEKTADPCNPEELDSLEECENDDKECKSKNDETRLKRQTNCEENPNCSYCNDTAIAEENVSYDYEEDLVVEPEVVNTIMPPLEANTDSIPIDEKIVIDASVEQVIDDNQATTDATKPLKLIERNIVVENDNETHYYRGYVDPSSNVTTIIRLTNLINNTNVVNMPTTLNNTNINNIHVYNNESEVTGGKYGLGHTEEGPCCFAMRPGICKKTTAGLKCQHKKKRVCGRQCTRKMIHTQRSFCNQIPYWPYMICPPQAPVAPPPYYPPPQFLPQFPPHIDDEFDDADDLPLFPEDNELENEESGWIVFQEKCKIVSEDGLQITNCTQKNVDFEHPYAKNSVDDANKRTPRHVGKMSAPHMQQQPPQQYQQPYYPYNYPMMQPMYFMPIPMYMPPPQYYQPPPLMNAYYPQQMPMPPIDTDSYYDEPIIQIREGNPYKNSKKHSRKHPIIVEHDDEL